MRERLVILAPALIPLAFLLVGLAVYVTLCLMGRRPPRSEKRERGNFFDFFIHYFVWLLGPVERGFLFLRFTPNSLTITALLFSAGAALAIGTSHLATAGWLYVGAGVLDVLDGRLARATGLQSKAGAFLDSVTDRWGELLVFSGFAWFLRDSAWLLAAMLAVAGSVMVSYARARGESLGVQLSEGIMQRSERMTLVSAGTLVTAWFHAGSDTAQLSPHVMGIALLLTGVGSTGTAISRWIRGYRLLKEQEESRRKEEEAEATHHRHAA